MSHAPLPPLPSFVHSRECESNAMMLASEKLGVLDFNTDEEKDAVDAVFSSALEVRHRVPCLGLDCRGVPA